MKPGAYWRTGGGAWLPAPPDPSRESPFGMSVPPLKLCAREAIADVGIALRPHVVRDAELLEAQPCQPLARDVVPMQRPAFGAIDVGIGKLCAQKLGREYRGPRGDLAPSVGCEEKHLRDGGQGRRPADDCDRLAVARERSPSRERRGGIGRELFRRIAREQRQD